MSEMERLNVSRAAMAEDSARCSEYCRPRHRPPPAPVRRRIQWRLHPAVSDRRSAVDPVGPKAPVLASTQRHFAGANRLPRRSFDNQTSFNAGGGFINTFPLVSFP
jgi:hypothetical protein